MEKFNIQKEYLYNCYMYKSFSPKLVNIQVLDINKFCSLSFTNNITDMPPHCVAYAQKGYVVNNLVDI